MKKAQYILLGVAVVIVILVGIMKPRSVSQDSQAVKLCYIWNTEAGDKATLVMNIDKDVVIGTFDFAPAEKDRKQGVFQGTVSAIDPASLSRTISAWWASNGEGVRHVEELSIILRQGIATPGFGEMKDEGDGSFTYAKPSEISYTLNLQQTDCSDPALQ